MRISARGLALIQHFEGFSGVIYRDVAGLQTIGYGHLIRPGEAAHYKEGINQAQASKLLQHDIINAEQSVNRFIAIALSQNRFDALVSFTFNLGGGALQRSTLRQTVNRGHHRAVRAQLLRWVYAGKTRIPGLITRRSAEASLYEDFHQTVTLY
jgi:GH24 family phage-related lysozyme (muramidase)